MRDNHILLDGLKEWNIELTKEQQQQFEMYYELLVEWNSFMNLTGITEYEEVLVKHFLDSIALADELRHTSNIKLMDMGTGAGFPGIPLKIVFPNIKVTLVDSLNKRINYLNEVIQKLGLEDIEAIHARAEELARKQEYREQYDLVVSRAVARTSTLAEFCMPYVKVGGQFIPYKSGKIEEELEEAKYAFQVLGGKFEKVKNFQIPNSDLQRSLIYVKKIKSTPKEYPRAGGKPLKTPIVKK